MSNLRTDYKDDVLDESVNTQRKFNIVQNDDGTVSFEDVTVYITVGSYYGGSDVNATNLKVNELTKKVDALTPIQPGGQVILTVENENTVPFKATEFARNGNIVIACEYLAYGIATSLNNGDEWTFVSTPHKISAIHYSNAKEKFFAMGNTGKKIYCGESIDGTTWSWTLMDDSSEACWGHKIEDYEDDVVFYSAYINATVIYYSYSYNKNFSQTELFRKSNTSSYAMDTVIKTTQSLFIRLKYSNDYRYVVVGNWGITDPESWSSIDDKNIISVNDYFTFYDKSSRALSFSKTFSTKDSVISKIIASGKEIRGFFTIGRYTYAFDQTTIARASGVDSVLSLPVEEYQSIGELIGIQSVLVLEGNTFLASTSGKIYKCTII